ncbi:Plasmodium exported protein (PHISTa), unknown, putative [Plasmodium sp. gorilla clade G1]|nr:Plasmodium exported protein (PHISTa), unknown, putative [Plasmodium sp. gorilla clade G1]
MIKKNSNRFPWYICDENRKGKLHYMSFKFLCLSLYIIGIYFVFLANSLENSSLDVVKICNVYKRNLSESEEKESGSKKKNNLKEEECEEDEEEEEEDVDKTTSNENDNESNEQDVEESENNNNNDLENSNIENESNNSTNNINYNDVSKGLTEEQLRNVLSSFEECPPNEDLVNIWTHTVGIAKDGFEDMKKSLKESVQKCFNNDIYKGSKKNDKTNLLCERIWGEHSSSLCAKVIEEEVKYTNEFSSLIKHEHTLDDIKKFIYSFLEFFKMLLNKLFEKHKKDITKSFEKILIKKK